MRPGVRLLLVSPEIRGIDRVFHDNTFHQRGLFVLNLPDSGVGIHYKDFFFFFFEESIISISSAAFSLVHLSI